MAFTVIGSAVGPSMFSVSLDRFGAYSVAALVCGSMAALTLAMAVFAENPQDRLRSATAITGIE
jgi:hypothetical protein